MIKLQGVFPVVLKFGINGSTAKHLGITPLGDPSLPTFSQENIVLTIQGARALVGRDHKLGSLHPTYFFRQVSALFGDVRVQHLGQHGEQLFTFRLILSTKIHHTRMIFHLIIFLIFSTKHVIDGDIKSWRSEKLKLRYSKVDFCRRSSLILVQ